MTLRQRWALWRERSRVVNRADLSVAEKVAVLQGNKVEPMLPIGVVDIDEPEPLALMVTGGPARVECECGRSHIVYPSFVKPEHVTADGRLRRAPSCENPEE